MLSASAAASLVVACVASSDTETPERLGQAAEAIAMSAVSPIDKVYVKGVAAPLDVETEYLPQVVCCENGGAPAEALKAQAVMARTYMAFSYFQGGKGASAAKPLTGTTADQAYFCTAKVSQGCTDAVSATKGQVTTFTDTKGVLSMNVTFFVDGPKPACLSSKSCTCPKPSPTTKMTPDAHPADCACFTFASMGAANPAYVTYNWANAGAAVMRSSIGGTDPGNRGCGSQNIQSCLAYAGWGYADQLRFFYGQDIALRHMDGSSVEGDPMMGSSSSGAATSSGGSSSDGQQATPGDAYAPPSGSRDDGGGGCSAARTPASAGVPFALGLAAAVGLLRRRMQRRQAPPAHSA